MPGNNFSPVRRWSNATSGVATDIPVPENPSQRFRAATVHGHTVNNYLFDGTPACWQNAFDGIVTLATVDATGDRGVIHADPVDFSAMTAEHGGRTYKAAGQFLTAAPTTPFAAEHSYLLMKAS